MSRKPVTVLLIVALAIECAGCSGRRTIVRGQSPDVFTIPGALPSGPAPLRAPAEGTQEGVAQVLPSAQATPGLPSAESTAVVSLGDPGKVVKQPQRENWLHRKIRLFNFRVGEATKVGFVNTMTAVVVVTIVVVVAALVAGACYLYIMKPDL